MALKILKASEPITVERLNVVLYAPPGIGKTSLAFTASKPLLLDFDQGAHRAANRGDTVRVDQWSDVDGLTAEDLEPFDTVIVDTVGRALDVLATDIIRKNPKHGTGGGALSLQGYGQLKARFVAFMKLLNSIGKDVVLIAHMDEQRNGDDVVERLDVQGGSKGEIYKTADMMGRLVMVNNRRELRFSPSDAAFGKNPAGLPPLAVPDASHPDFIGFLASIITQTKDSLNELTEAQHAAMQEQEWFATNLPTFTTADDINAVLTRAKAAGKGVALMVHRYATEAIGLHFDKDVGRYMAPKQEAKAEAEVA